MCSKNLIYDNELFAFCRELIQMSSFVLCPLSFVLWSFNRRNENEN